MLAISQAIKKLNTNCALIPFITAGDPDLKSTAKAIKYLDLAGADIIELGLPYSVPLADGTIIQNASNRALTKGTCLDQVLNIVQLTANNISAPIILYTYYNLVLSRGIATFIKDISRVGIKGLLIPDLPLEESDYLNFLCTSFNIELIFLIAPTSSPKRIRNIIQKSSGCIYLVSKTGVTGIYSDIKSQVKNIIYQIKTLTNKPIILGFGISTTKQVQQIRKLNVEGIVMGSAFVQKLSEGSPEEGINQLSQFCKEIKRTILE